MRAEQPLNAYASMLLRPHGRRMEVSCEQELKARDGICVREAGSLTVASILQ